MFYFLREVTLLIMLTFVFAHSVVAKADNSDNSFNKCIDKFPLSKIVNLVDTPEIVERYGNTQFLCYKSFVVLYSTKNKTPVYSVTRLSKEQEVGAKLQRRVGTFYSDTGLSAGSASLKDYKNSGWDRGHATPAGDMADYKSMGESFVLTNVFPQEHYLNVGGWRRLESDISSFALKHGGETFVFTGTIYTGRINMAGGVRVPDTVYKVVYNTLDKCVKVYTSTNNKEGGNVVIDRTKESKILSITGVDFPKEFVKMCK